MKKIKQFCSSLLAISILSNSFVFATDYNFSDISNHWAKNEILNWAKNEIILGYNGNFSPDDFITRGQFAVILDRIMGYQGISDVNFADLDENYYTEALLKTNNAGIILGDGASIDPNGYATREQVATMICRALYYDTSNYTNTTFSDDLSINEYARSSVAYLQSKEIINGKSENAFMPQDFITRAELICILDRAIDLLVLDDEIYENSTYQNVVINTQNATLENLTINGDLILAEGIADGDVTLNNVQVNGNIIIKGGGENSVYFNQVVVNGVVIIEKEYGAVRVVTSGDGSIETIEVYGEVIINSQDATSGTIDNIIIKDATSVTLLGDFQKVTNEAENSNIIVTGSIDNIIMTETGTINDNIVIKGNELDKVPTTDVLTTPDSNTGDNNSSSSSSSSSGSTSVSTYNITIDDNIENGVITTDLSSASAGKQITITATADSGYELESITVTNDKFGSTIDVVDNKFNMSVSDVTITAVFVKSDDTETPEEENDTTGSYKITIDSDIENGTIKTNKSTANAGETITITATAKSGYELDSITVTNDKFSSTIDVVDNKFNMSVSDVTITAVFVLSSSVPDIEDEKTDGKYTIKIDDSIENGTIQTNQSTGDIGDVITIYATANTGYKLESLSVKNSFGSPMDITNNQFVMTISDVVISATFVKTDSEDGFTLTAQNTTLGGSVQVSKNLALEGEQIQITATPDDGYYLSSLYYVLNGERVEIDSEIGWFLMPNSDIYYGAVFELTSEAELPRFAVLGGTIYKDIATLDLKTIGGVGLDVNYIPSPNEFTVSYSNGTKTITTTPDYVDFVPADTCNTIRLSFDEALDCTSSSSIKVVYTGTTIQDINGAKMAQNDYISGFIYSDNDAPAISTYYNITTNSEFITTNKTSAIKNTVITLLIHEKEGYELKSLEYFCNDETTEIFGYSFKMPEGDVEIIATYEPISYDISVDDIEGISILADEKTAIILDEIVLDITVNDGYTLSKIFYTKTDDENNEIFEILANDGIYSFVMPASNIEISAILELLPYTISKNDKIENGDISLSQNTAKLGDEISVYITPNDGYFLTDLFYISNGITTKINDYKFEMPAFDVVVSATFERISYDITVDNSIENGSILASQTQGKIFDEINVSFSPDSGYELINISYIYNGITTEIVKNNGKYSFLMPADNVEITATFKETEIAYYSISVDTNIINGTISSNKTTANEGIDIDVTITPDDGYKLASLSYISNGITTEINDFTFKMPLGDVIITATFDKISYDITIDNSIENGSISTNLSTAQILDDIEVTLNPSVGYEISNISYIKNNETFEILKTNDKYTFKMPASDIEITATFEKIPYNITIDDSIENGEIFIENNISTFGEVIEITVLPSEHYRLLRLSYNNIEITNFDGVYSFVMPTNDVEITAIFEEIPSFDIVIDTNIENGEISVENTNVKTGEEIVVTITPNSSYSLSKLYYTYDDKTFEITANNGVYSFIMPENDIEITAEFVKNASSYQIKSEVYNDGLYSNYGTISVNKSSAKYGDNVTITLTETSGGQVGLLRLYYVKDGETEKHLIPATTPYNTKSATVNFEMVDADITIFAEFSDILDIKSGAGSYVNDTQIKIYFYSSKNNPINPDTIVPSEFKLYDSSSSSVYINPTSYEFSYENNQCLTLNFSSSITSKIGQSSSKWIISYTGTTLENTYSVKMLTTNVSF